MLFKPLSFKGPSDHLNQFFAESTLFDGFKLLLANGLSQWQQDMATGQLHARVEEKQQTFQCSISWPIEQDSFVCQCNQDACHHLAALAIDSKRRLDAIAYQIKEPYDERQVWRSLQQKLQQTRFDPYPNMARHRVVYLLKRLDNGFSIVIYKAYLTQDNRYQLKEKLDLSLLLNKKLPKFITLTDQYLLQVMHQNQPQIAQEPAFLLNELAADKQELFIDLLIKTQRCFWKACSRPPLRMIVSNTDESLKPNNFFEHLGQGFYLDVSHNQVIHQVTAWTQLDEIVEPVQPHIHLCSIEGDHLPIKLTTPTDPIALSYAKVFFVDANQQTFSFADLARSLEPTWLHHKVATWLRQLQHIATLAQHYELFISQQFDPSDRDISGPLSASLVWLYELHCLGWTITIDRSFKFNRQIVHDWAVNLEAQQDWFNLSIGVLIDGNYVNILPSIVSAIKSKKIKLDTVANITDLTLHLEDGSLITMPAARVKSILTTLLELFDRKPLQADGQLKVAHHQLIRVSQLDSSVPSKTLSDYKNRLTALSENRLSAQTVKVTPSGTAELRPYQVEGVQWLKLLYQSRLAGVLADDMGLGKTLQSLVFLQSVTNHQPSLIVAPTSLLSNWRQEIERFTPEQTTLVYYGNERHQEIESLNHVNLVITSYGVIQRDINRLKQVNFNCVILDEAQAIKNSKTQVARSCFQLNAQFRLCLTGTPVENHLGEVWSLFNFLMPGFLGSESSFNKIFRQAIEKHHDSETYQQLSQKVAPFMLRRTKSEVAQELPPKLTIERHFELSQTQADMYESIRLAMTEEIQKILNASNTGKPTMLIGNALLRLRQICCHPKLIDWPNVDPMADSAKLNWLIEVLPEMIEEGRRILIFSSFRKMLDIIAQALQSLSIQYLSLTGQSRDRGKIVEKFQNLEAPVFLISLKAGGAGLNLTAADTVIHFDPWWNPAAEAQASDRAYRIGQDKTVFVYKLITRGTVEEKIQKMQQSKAELSQQLYNSALSSLDELQTFDWNNLLAPIATLDS
ncbi:MAG: DEAD/DEAH box helicase [Gammaproteobacteria bacterium]|nr:DEAD/DEAH box helicase [Gammaproteobacteria bacterium]